MGLGSSAPGAETSDLDGSVLPFRRVWRVALDAVRIVWAGARAPFVASMAISALRGAGLGVQLLVGQQGLETLLETQRTRGSVGVVVPWVLAFAAIGALLMFAAAVQREIQLVLGERVACHMQGRILEVAAAVDLEAFEDPGFHNRLQRVQQNQNRPPEMASGLTSLMANAVGIAGVTVALVLIAPVLIPLLFVVPVLAWFAASRRGNALFDFFCRVTPRDRRREYLSRLLSEREAAAEVRAYGLTGMLRDRHERLYRARVAELERIARSQLKYSLAANVGMSLALAGAMILLTWLTVSGRIGIADAGVAVAGLSLVGARLSEVGVAVGALSEAGLYTGDYLAFVAIRRRLAAARPTRCAPAGFARLDVDRLTFSYPGASRPAVDGVTLHVDRGEIVALVGRNGSGKTTLAKLLAGLYRPTGGRIAWDGVDTATIDPERLRDHVAVVFQDYLHFHLAAYENIGLGRHGALEDVTRIRQAAHDAGAHDLLSALPDGYGTMLGPEFDGGTDLSKGQWQRVALARAFFRDAPFVILDEASAALDARAEWELFLRMRMLFAGRTVLFISHRFANVRAADRIYVLDRGRVVEHGSHRELLALDGTYAEMFACQAAAYADEEEPGWQTAPS